MSQDAVIDDVPDTLHDALHEASFAEPRALIITLLGIC
jgi:hypothetical protein